MGGALAPSKAPAPYWLFLLMCTAGGAPDWFMSSSNADGHGACVIVAMVFFVGVMELLVAA